ncbi:MAG: hypothetical protein ACI97A_001669 [Planctomycetota bacterium]|jgi:hypothetical protein
MMHRQCRKAISIEMAFLISSTEGENKRIFYLDVIKCFFRNARTLIQASAAATLS